MEREVSQCTPSKVKRKFNYASTNLTFGSLHFTVFRLTVSLSPPYRVKKTSKNSRVAVILAVDGLMQREENAMPAPKTGEIVKKCERSHKLVTYTQSCEWLRLRKSREFRPCM